MAGGGGFNAASSGKVDDVFKFDDVFQIRTLVIIRISKLRSGIPQAKNDTELLQAPTTEELLVYDMTQRKSFDHIPRWLEELRAHADKNIVIILIGNKTHLEDQRSVPMEDDKEFADKEELF